MKLRVKYPFHLTRRRGRERLDFPPGVHEIDQATWEHWFVQAQVADGRAELIADQPTPSSDVDNQERPDLDPGGNDPEAVEEERRQFGKFLAEKKVAELRQLATDLNIEGAAASKKEDLIEQIMAATAVYLPPQGEETPTATPGPSDGDSSPSEVQDNPPESAPAGDTASVSTPAGAMETPAT